VESKNIKPIEGWTMGIIEGDTAQRMQNLNWGASSKDLLNNNELYA
jgi:hypothetical protein